MPIWAVSDVVWQALIAGAVTVTLAYMQMRAARKVEEVKRTLAETTALHGEKLDEYHREVNGMKAQLVDEVRKASFAQGAKSEKDKLGAG